jgi:hypothetical protein
MNVTLNAPAGQWANATGTRHDSGRSVSGMRTYLWSTAATTPLAVCAVAPISGFDHTKPHAQRPKEASR